MKTVCPKLIAQLTGSGSVPVLTIKKDECKCIGWSLAWRMHCSLPLQALELALSQWKTHSWVDPPFWSGRQYRSFTYVNRLRSRASRSVGPYRDNPQSMRRWKVSLRRWNAKRLSASIPDVRGSSSPFAELSRRRLQHQTPPLVVSVCPSRWVWSEIPHVFVLRWYGLFGGTPPYAVRFAVKCQFSK